MLKTIAAKIGVDKAIFYTASARVFQGVGGIVSVLLIASFLSGIEQGFYYTFASILAIQVFFELGLAGIITQFVAHERAHLQEIDQKLVGSPKHLSRLASLLRFCVKWYAILAVALFVILAATGYIFFSHFYTSEVEVQWSLPWILMAAGTALNFILAPISAYLEGLGKVREIAKIRLIQQIVTMSAVWLGLFLGLKLYVVILPSFLTVIILIWMGYPKFGVIIKNLYKVKVTERISYRNEIFPYQWRIALSWVSGYFIFQLFNPVLFATEGAVIAGQMGMTLTILNAIQALGLSWISTKVPQLSSLIAVGEYVELDTIFNRTVKQMLSLVLFALVAMLGGVYILRHFEITIRGIVIADRLLPLLPMLMMMIAMFINQYIAAIATYLRCHKKEPFMVNSIVCGILCALSTVILGRHFGVMGMTIGYCVITVVMLPWGHYLFTSNKKLWHNE